MTPACDQCRFFHHLANDPDESDAPKSIKGECRRHPPVARPPIGDRIDRDDHQLAAFPRVVIFDWCGEFERRIQSESLGA